MSEPPRPEMARERGAMSGGLVGVLAGRFDHRLPAGDLAFEPGSKFEYLLTNWFLVVAIVEAATGKPFQQAMASLLRALG